ncbi:MAG: hypothetical protein HY897_21395 [Deltaproteobacteria bacterium]|nr:hypothetical protein [Deltaproteobacteria bacterium]
MTGFDLIVAAALSAAIQTGAGAPTKAAPAVEPPQPAAPAPVSPPPRMPAINALFKINYELVDEIIATVQKDAITRSDLDRQAGVTVVKTYGLQGLATLADPKVVGWIKDLLINQVLILQEIRKQPGESQRTSDEEAREEVKKFAARFPDAAAYQQFLTAADMSEDALKEILVRDMRVDRFIKTRIQHAVPVPDDKVREYFDENAAQFPGKKFEDVAGQLKAMLTEKEFLEKFIKDLRNKYDVVDHLEKK